MTGSYLTSSVLSAFQNKARYKEDFVLTENKAAKALGLQADELSHNGSCGSVAPSLRFYILVSLPTEFPGHNVQLPDLPDLWLARQQVASVSYNASTHRDKREEQQGGVNQWALVDPSGELTFSQEVADPAPARLSFNTSSTLSSEVEINPDIQESSYTHSNLHRNDSSLSQMHVNDDHAEPGLRKEEDATVQVRPVSYQLSVKKKGSCSNLINNTKHYIYKDKVEDLEPQLLSASCRDEQGGSQRTSYEHRAYGTGSEWDQQGGSQRAIHEHRAYGTGSEWDLKAYSHTCQKPPTLTTTAQTFFGTEALYRVIAFGMLFGLAAVLAMVARMRRMYTTGGCAPAVSASDPVTSPISTMLPTIDQLCPAMSITDSSKAPVHDLARSSHQQQRQLSSKVFLNEIITPLVAVALSDDHLVASSAVEQDSLPCRPLNQNMPITDYEAFWNSCPRRVLSAAFSMVASSSNKGSKQDLGLCTSQGQSVNTLRSIRPDEQPSNSMVHSDCQPDKELTCHGGDAFSYHSESIEKTATSSSGAWTRDEQGRLVRLGAQNQSQSDLTLSPSPHSQYMKSPYARKEPDVPSKS
ncbi:hypothetical protein CEUSTIGMA_g13012.t1 [Chlamydomonas eustigma]|uniref:Uncharacterized protein n=1 Tax=Chlamydomonas eustigma TaxID=1157962 RepID=A0A250XR97_9CHLO|nr:hypothetical protein CEUSTIGMA_g13012.t1 [Chlamydomonas eustigma]|eukprot:GAX85597.1 hypothetical protein CEUSTIGMA_g13012.t1 [Chlamydomonas eustigma]